MVLVEQLRVGRWAPLSVAIVAVASTLVATGALGCTSGGGSPDSGPGDRDAGTSALDARELDDAAMLDAYEPHDARAMPDAAALDAGTDAATSDASAADAPTDDSGRADAWIADAGFPDAGPACPDGTCSFTGEVGASWTEHPFVETICLEEHVPRGATDLYAAGRDSLVAYELLAARVRPETRPPFALADGCSFAYLAGSIAHLSPTDFYVYSVATSEWRVASLGTDLGALGMTITDGLSVWSANDHELIQGMVATTGPRLIPAGTTGMIQPRLTYDALTDRVYFAGRFQPVVRSYDEGRDELGIETVAPADIGAPFCSDRDGHLYVGSALEPRRLWQYSVITRRWRDLPLLPDTVTGVTNCSVAEVGGLYVAARPGTTLFRLELERP